MKLTTAALALFSTAPLAAAFQPGLFRPRAAAALVSPRTPASLCSPLPSRASAPLRASADDGDDEAGDENPPENPYADPNYPDLEYINYDDPNYNIDQGVVGDEFFPTPSKQAEMEASGDDVEEQIEEMREERRRTNDEYQFETYHQEILKDGEEEYRGEWTLYRTSTFLPPREGVEPDEASAPPRLIKARKELRVVSSGRKIAVETESDWRVDGERLVHEETIEAPSSSSSDDDDGPTDEAFEQEILSNTYWPELTSADDFRGPQGIMCVGNAYTICDTVPLDGAASKSEEPPSHDGPFSEYRAEIGIQYKRMRLRVKLDYRTKDDGDEGVLHPPLCLRSLTVCREALERWPRHFPEGRTDVDDAPFARLFGPGTGADGGLYDPPPVGSDEQAAQYTMIDLEGHATLLFPHSMDQTPDAFDGNGWVTSLDWAPGRIRYQVDRKVEGGTTMKGLRTLELSEVQGEEADEYRPRDGGADMQQ